MLLWYDFEMPTTAIPLDVELLKECEPNFWKKVDKTGECWLWTAALSHDGYGKFGVKRRKLNINFSLYAHRVAWVLLSGSDIPEGLTVDHLCRVRKCVNTAHMELVTIGENGRRGTTGEAGANFQREKTHCPRNHEYTAENTAPNQYGRSCMTCRREAARLIRDAHKTLGMTQKEYIKEYGASRATAEAVLTVTP